eukprot:CAMPEP_0171295748 /NCGR_PEP_ID=MMETSP0816-20121228/4375_1 /TAXON_ID=420281 /ORGANISM="Proboscia inermis, Strain CCAP1064/1" /LENGTH=86 /DNA_ID=CAMNT_0011768661 /DNA_START=90 /DNA_END=350 /DNA_ORIENTATION=-
MVDTNRESPYRIRYRAKLPPEDATPPPASGHGHSLDRWVPDGFPAARNSKAVSFETSLFGVFEFRKKDFPTTKQKSDITSVIQTQK